jgi:hypothetical protein
MTDEPKSTATQLGDISACMARARELAEGVRKNAETSGFATPVVDAMALQAYQIALNKELDAYHDATCKSCRQHESKRARSGLHSGTWQSCLVTSAWVLPQLVLVTRPQRWSWGGAPA